MSNKKSISVVIPSFNGKDLLDQNLPFLFAALQFSAIDFEVFVCDDCSSDNSISFLEEFYPEIKILKQEVNKGFSPTINLGIRNATKDLVFILNNDVTLSENYFEAKFKYFKNHDTFGVMGKIVGTNGETQDTAKFPEISFLKIKGTVNYELQKEEKDFWHPTFMLSGANSLVCRENIQVLNGFDELFAPFYWEDVDLSVRAWKMGWKCYYEPNSICIHPTSSTIGKIFKKRAVKIVAERNKYFLHLLHLESNQLFWYRMKILFKSFLPLVVFKKDKWESYKAFKSKKIEFLESKNRFEILRNSLNQTKSLKDIKAEIVQILADKELKKF
jgi:GT2 family glycosyltransferase